MKRENGMQYRSGILMIATAFVVACGGQNGEKVQPTASTEKAKAQVVAKEAPKEKTGAGGLQLDGWLSWRGPEQNGVSQETGILEKLDTPLWTHDVSGGGTPVVVNDRVFVFGYYGENEELQEALVCLEARTGKVIWEKRFSDFISDIVYNRYGIGAPAVDVETGNVYIVSSAGLFMAFDWDGKKLWEHSLLEEYGRLTFPNGRVGCAVVDEDKVIVRGITANWGKEGPARDRFYGFDKKSGELLWRSTPAVQPIDSSFSTPVFQDLEDGRRVFYSGTGCGNMVCVDARTGEAIWRFQVSTGGVNSTPVLYGKDRLIVIHGKENLDSSVIGRMISLKIPTRVPTGVELPIVLGEDSEAWRIDEGMKCFTSSPVVKGDDIYVTVQTGELKCVDAKTGKVKWEEKLSPDQLHASPLYADGKLYAPMFDGKIHALKVEADGVKRLSEFHAGSPCLGAPSLWQGRLYVHAKHRLYCFGPEKVSDFKSGGYAMREHQRGDVTQLRVVPAEFILIPGEKQEFRVDGLDAKGHFVKSIKGASFEKFIPPTARVKAKVDATLSQDGVLTAGNDAKQSAGAIKVTSNGLSAVTRGRVLASKTYREGFEGFELKNETKDGVKFAYPPLSWLSARVRWQVRDMDGDKVLGNTLDRLLFQRTRSFIGDPDMSEYTLQADVMSDGNRRILSDVGLVNQRYFIYLSGNRKILEVSSNHDRVKVSVPFKMKAKVWYTLKTQVDLNQDGSGVVKAKVWERDGEEPSEWTIEVPHQTAHQNGAPGLYAFSPQSKKRVYVDNIIFSVDSRAKDWPMWGRDETRNMVSDEKGIVTTFESGEYKGNTEEIDMETTKSVDWVAKLGSQTYGNPSIADGKVYVGTNNENPRDEKVKGDRGILMCFDEKSGEFLWQLAVPKLGAGKVSDWEYIGICSSPVVEGDRLYLVTNRCEVVCLDVNGLANGNDGYQDEAKYMADPGKEPVTLGKKDADIIWVYDMRDELGVFPHNIASNSPLLVGDQLIVSTSNGMDWSHTNIPAPSAPSLISLNKKTGELIGEEASEVSTRILHCNWSSPAYAKVGGEEMILWGGGDGFAYGFSPKVKKDEDGFAIFPELWRLDCTKPYREKDGEKLRYATEGGPSEIIGTVVYHDGLAYAAIGQDPEHGDGVGALTCIDPTKRGDLTDGGAKWIYKEVGRTVSTPSVADGLVYLAEYAGKIHCLDAKTGEKHWVYDTQSRIWGSTLVVDGKVFIGTEDGELVVLQAGKEMKHLESNNVGSPIYSTPVAANGSLYVATQTHLYKVTK